MSTKYTGGFITKSPVAPTSSAASGIWTLDQQQQAQKAGTWPSPPIFIEDLFSTYLYTGTGAAQTITNNIDLSGQGGLVWIKRRDATGNHNLFDTARGATKKLYSDLTNAEYTDAFSLTSFNSNGFSVGVDVSGTDRLYASWTFRKQPKFFDVVTYTGNNATGIQNIAHNLGSVPGTIIVKCIDAGPYDWIVYHRSLGATKYAYLNTTAAADTFSGYWNNTEPTSTQVTVGTSGGVNGSGQTYVAYLFAHDAGGFPVSGGGSTNGISCGSFSTDGSGNATVNLGYEPQWLMYKCSSAVGDWEMVDVMRGWVVGVNNDNGLRANSSDAESTGSNRGEPSSTGFNCVSFPTNRDFIYIAIRRGPMKTPTVGTSVFSPVTATTVLDNNSLPSAGFPIDMSLLIDLAVSNKIDVDRLRGKGGGALLTDATNSELFTTYFNFDAQTNLYVTGTLNSNVIPYVFYNFRRAPSFFDEVCGTATGFAINTQHNLGVVPELLILKARAVASSWQVTSPLLGDAKNAVFLNSDSAIQTAGADRYTATSTNYTSPSTSMSGAFVLYLFATCAGVSKVGSYTGTAALQTVNCGFTGGARFVLIKRTDSTGDWWTYDSARGITSGNDPYLYLNSSAAEVTGTNYVDTDTTGFKVTAAAPAGLNASGGTYIFLAIA